MGETPDKDSFVMGKLSTLLSWHAEDPVSDEESARNARICTTYQFNRNPFIDHPEFVNCVFSNDCTVSPSPPPLPPWLPPPPLVPPSPPSVPTPPSSPPVDVLEAGDCAVVFLQADSPDEVGVLLLDTLQSGTALFFTDGGVDSDGSLRVSEGVKSYTPASNLPAGTVLTLSDFETSVSGSVALSANGDQAILFTGSTSSPTYICALSTYGSGSWQSTADSSTESALPFGLTDGEHVRCAHPAPITAMRSSLRVPPPSVSNPLRVKSAREPGPSRGRPSLHVPRRSHSLTTTTTCTAVRLRAQLRHCELLSMGTHPIGLGPTR